MRVGKYQAAEARRPPQKQKHAGRGRLTAPDVLSAHSLRHGVSAFKELFQGRVNREDTRMSVLTAECAKSAESIPVFCFFPFRDFWVFRGEKWGKSINRAWTRIHANEEVFV